MSNINNKPCLAELEIDLKTVNFEIDQCEKSINEHKEELYRLQVIKQDIETEISKISESIEHHKELLDFYNIKLNENERTEEENSNLFLALCKIDKILSSMDYEFDSISSLNLHAEINYITLISDKTFEEIIDFLITNNTIKPIKALLCETCDTVLASFRGLPTQDELSDYLYEKYICSTCKNEIDHNTSVAEIVDLPVFYLIEKNKEEII